MEKGLSARWTTRAPSVLSDTSPALAVEEKNRRLCWKNIEAIDPVAALGEYSFMPPTHVIFDTNCLLCSGLVKFILRHERRDDIIFVNAWSDTGLEMAKSHGLTHEDLNQTFLVIRSERGFIKSDAALEIFRSLKMPWRAMRILRFVPRPLRDLVYTVIAKHRYEWFGYEPSCTVVPPEQSYRFIKVDSDK